MSLLAKFTGCIGFAVNPFVALSAQRNQIAYIVSKGGVARPRFDVVGMKPFWLFLTASASLALIVISLVHLSYDLLPLTRSIEFLPFWCTSIFVIGVLRSSSFMHSITSASQIRLRYRGFLAENLFGFFSMCSALERVRNTRPFHIVVVACEVQSPGSCWNSKCNQFPINGFGITTNDATNLIGRKSLINIFFAQPNWVQVVRFSSHRLTNFQSIGWAA